MQEVCNRSQASQRKMKGLSSRKAFALEDDTPLSAAGLRCSQSSIDLFRVKFVLILLIVIHPPLTNEVFLNIFTAMTDARPSSVVQGITLLLCLLIC